MNETKAFQEALKEDVKTMLDLKLDVVAAGDFYRALAKAWVRYFIALSLANFVVVYGLHFTSSFYIGDINHISQLIMPNVLFATVIMVFQAQYHVFTILAADKLKSISYIKATIGRLELIFLAIYIFFYAFCLQTEGDINGSLLGSQLSGFVCAALVMALVVMFESQRVGLPVMFELIAMAREKIEKHHRA